MLIWRVCVCFIISYVRMANDVQILTQKQKKQNTASSITQCVLFESAKCFLYLSDDKYRNAG